MSNIHKELPHGDILAEDAGIGRGDNLRALADGFMTVVAAGALLAAVALATSLIARPNMTEALATPAPSPSLARVMERSCVEQVWPNIAAECLTGVEGRTLAPPHHVITAQGRHGNTSLGATGHGAMHSGTWPQR